MEAPFPVTFLEKVTKNRGCVSPRAQKPQKSLTEKLPRT
jgi:hypothetical protein